MKLRTTDQMELVLDLDRQSCRGVARRRYGLWTVDCRLWIVDYGLGLQVSSRFPKEDSLIEYIFFGCSAFAKASSAV